MSAWKKTFQDTRFKVFLFGAFALVSVNLVLYNIDAVYNTAQNVIIGQCVKRLPKAIVVGPGKCGTGTINVFLNEHPDIRFANKEVGFFNHYYNKTLTWYRSIMPCTYPHQISAEKTPGYFSNKIVPSRILSMDKDIKLIFMLRDPVERALSIYLHGAEAGKNEGKEFLEMIFLPDVRTVDSSSAYIGVSRYIVHIRRWLEYFNITNMIFIDADLFRDNPWIELKRIEKFLGVRDYFTEDMFPFVEKRGERCVKQMSGDFKCMNKRKGRVHPKIEEESEKLLRNYFAPFNRQLFELLNTTFDWE